MIVNSIRIKCEKLIEIENLLFIREAKLVNICQKCKDMLINLIVGVDVTGSIEDFKEELNDMFK